MRSILTFAFILQLFIGFSQTSQELFKSTNTFIESVDKAFKTELIQDFKNSERVKWTNLPVGMAKRPGIKYGSMSNSAKINFHELLITIFSSQGYLKTTSIMQLDDMLNAGIDLSLKENKIQQNQATKNESS